VIALDGVAARRRPLALASVSVAWGTGVHAVLGGREDGGELLLALIAGTVRPRSGRVTVLDGVAHDPTVRKRVSLVLLDPSLPDALRVDETMALAAAIRGEPPRAASDRLGVLGVESLATRPVRSLSLPEARAVALAEAVTSSRVSVLLVEEPLLSIDPRASVLLPQRLRARGADGCTVVVLTSSARDAGELADDHVVLRRGAITARAAAIETLSSGSQAGALRVVARDSHGARALVAALAREDGVDGVAQDGTSVVARGRDAITLARTVGRAIVGAKVDVAEMRFDTLPGETPAEEVAK
jgi:ABC-2 type transport system ATP-binding protein